MDRESIEVTESPLQLGAEEAEFKLLPDFIVIDVQGCLSSMDAGPI